MTIHLQGIGRVPAKLASDLVVGDVTLWNYGYPAEVVGLEPKGSASIVAVLRDRRTGREDRRTLRRSTLVGVES